MTDEKKNEFDPSKMSPLQKRQVRVAELQGDAGKVICEVRARLRREGYGTLRKSDVAFAFSQMTTAWVSLLRNPL